MRDYQPYAVPISVKGVVIDEGRIWLRQNERDEWELPGGKLDEGEQPEDTVAREMKEELGFEVAVGSIVGAHVYTIQQSLDETRGVLVISYICDLLCKVGDFELEGEAGKAEFESFTPDEIVNLRMPQFYKLAIETAMRVRGLA